MIGGFSSTFLVLAAVGAYVAMAIVRDKSPLDPIGVVIAPLADLVERGARLTTCTVNADGVVLETPDALVAQAAATVGRYVDVDAYSLARMVRSEDESAGQIAKTYKCHVALNQATALGWGITQLITFHTNAARAGRYGAQITGRFASGRDPYQRDLDAAEYALADRAAGNDPTGGATNFLDVGGMGKQPGSTSFEEVRAKWAQEGKVPGTLADTPVGLVFFWRGQVPETGTPV